MSGDRYERMSEYQRRTTPMSEKLGQAALNLQQVFAGESELNITESASGDRRVRAYIPDEDGYAGWIENSQFIGAVEKLGEHGPRYVVEQHYPNLPGAGKPTYIWEFTPQADMLTVRHHETTGGQPDLGFAVPADEEKAGNFVWITSELLYARRLNRFEGPLHRGRYTFELPELQ